MSSRLGTMQSFYLQLRVVALHCAYNCLSVAAVAHLRSFGHSASETHVNDQIKQV